MSTGAKAKALVLVLLVVLLAVQAAPALAYGCHRGSYNAYSGDTIDSIAARYGLRPSTLARLNGLPVDDAVMTGQTFITPDCRRRR